MKILFIIDETPFFHPDYLDNVIKNLKNDRILVGITKKIPKKSNLSYQLFKKVYLLEINEIISLIYKRISFILLNLLFPKGLNGKNFSVEGVCKKREINYFIIEKNINKKKYIDKIKKFSPKIVLSSNSLYFSKKVLEINSLFVNRHSSLLPKYKGLFPILHAIINKEKYVGVSLHLMNKKYDQGDIFLQKKIKINKIKNLSAIYNQCFEISSVLTVKLIKLFKKKLLVKKKNVKNNSYFSFPNVNEIKKFKNLGWKFI